MNRRVWLCSALGALLILQAIATEAGAQMRLTRSRPYVMGYRVEGNFVIPVMGTLENGVFMDTNSSGQSYPQAESPPMYYPPNSKDVDNFLASPETAAWVAESKKGEPAAAPSVPPAAPVVTGQVRLTGILKLAEDGRLCLLVGAGTEAKLYDLSANEHFKETLPTLGKQEFRGHFTGIVARADPYPTFYVQSGWVEPL